MPFTVKKLKAINTGSLDKLGDSVVDLAKYTEDEFAAVASAFQDTYADPIWNRPPPRPRRGTYAYADGTNWNPGRGEGPYFFDGTNWFPMRDPTLPIGMSPITSSLGADITMNDNAYHDGPSVAQGSVGTWFVTGGVTVYDTGAAASFTFKLWDGTTIIDSGYASTGGANFGLKITLSGFITNPVGNLKISARDVNATPHGLMSFNVSTNGKDSTITAFRIA